MAPKTRLDSKKAEIDRLHALVVNLLKEEENKYCADCEAKQPRWASWNLGVFLCIRCAGIHRNLGVHLTKVKSVNLDSWTAEQVQSMRVMGNKLAKKVYEAELPEHFRRPQTDQALESFIRAKYEHKRYMLKDWSPPRVDIADLPPPPDKRHSGQSGSKRKVDSTVVELPRIPLQTEGQVSKISPNLNTTNEPSLLDLDEPIQLGAPTFNFDEMLNKSKSQTVGNSPNDASSSQILNLNFAENADADGMEDFGPIVSAQPIVNQSQSTSTPSSDLKSPIVDNMQQNIGDLASLSLTEPSSSEKKSTSDILALFGATPTIPIRPIFPVAQVPIRTPMPLGAQGDRSFPAKNVTNVSTREAEPFASLVDFGSSNMDSMRQMFSSRGVPASGPRMTVPFDGMGAPGFPNKETAALFAAASPFANPLILPHFSGSNFSGANNGKASGGANTLLTHPVQQPNVADFLQFNLGVSTGSVETNRVTQSNNLWN